MPDPNIRPGLVSGGHAIDATAPDVHPEPSFAISDAVHGGANEHFYWLPPLVPAPSPTGTFDGSLAPAVRITEFAAGTLVAEFTTTTGPGSETVRVVPEDEHYIVNWHTSSRGADPRTRSVRRRGGLDG